MITEEEARRLEEMDPRVLNTEQQCAYVIKCIEAEMSPEQIMQSRFKGDRFAFDIVMSFAVRREWIAKDRKSGRWYVNRR
jgi:hypothetical protein